MGDGNKQVMSSDDPTKKLPNDDGKTTQPMISDVFKLVEELKASTEAGFVSMKQYVDTRFDALKQDIDARFDAMKQDIDARFDAMSDEMRSGFMRLEDKVDRDRLHSEADYHELLKRIRQIETRAS
jgi:hypothetical protein